MTDLKLHDPMRPLIHNGNMFFDAATDSFGFMTINGRPSVDDRSGTPRRWMDEDFYMHSPEADAFYDKIREATIVFEAGIEIAHEGTVNDQLFVSYDSAKEYAETLSDSFGEAYISARFLRD